MQDFSEKKCFFGQIAKYKYQETKYQLPSTKGVSHEGKTKQSLVLCHLVLWYLFVPVLFVKNALLYAKKRIK